MLTEAPCRRCRLRAVRQAIQTGLLARMRAAWLALAVLLAGTAHGQYTSNLSAVWVPTDGDAALISSLTNLNVTEPENFISGAVH